MSKIQIVMDAYGYNNLDDLMADFMIAGAVPGICQEFNCNNIEEYEPDQRNGYCNECGKKSVKSIKLYKVITLIFKIMPVEGK